MRISVFGAGYVGLVTATCFAEMGNDVFCVDTNAERVEKLRSGEVPIFEPGLEGLLQHNLASKRLQFSTSQEEAIAHGNVIFIAVGTPSGADGSADLKYVDSVARSIGEHISERKVIVNKSTVPVGTGDRVSKIIKETQAERGSDVPYDVVSNPEFLKEGAAISDFMKPDRIIIGSESDYGSQQMEALYAPFNRNHDKVFIMSLRSAEMTKYAANIMLATRISLMNELGNVAELVGADIEEVRKGIGSDPRIGPSFIYAGTGYGGSCFPKDVRALINTARENDFTASIVESVEKVNERQKTVLVDKIHRLYGNDLSGKTFALWGIAFKPNTDDTREAPSIAIIKALVASGAKIQAFDPVAHYDGDPTGVTICDSHYAALEGANALIIATEWNEFRSPDFDLIGSSLSDKVIFDGRNLYDGEYLATCGLQYHSIGRPANS